MPDNPVPLREALREAVGEMNAVLSSYVVCDFTDRDREQLERALARIGILIEQIPIVFEAREGDDG